MLKALGYSWKRIALSFAKVGLSVFGCIDNYSGGYAFFIPKGDTIFVEFTFSTSAVNEIDPDQEKSEKNFQIVMTGTRIVNKTAVSNETGEIIRFYVDIK